MTDKVLLDIEGMARVLDVSTKTIRRYIDERAIPYMKVKGTIRFDRDMVIDHIMCDGIPSEIEEAADPELDELIADDSEV